jgi:hypothetical protein
LLWKTKFNIDHAWQNSQKNAIKLIKILLTLKKGNRFKDKLVLALHFNVRFDAKNFVFFLFVI